MGMEYFFNYGATWGILIISFLTSIFSKTINSLFRNKNKFLKIRKEQKEIKEKIKKRNVNDKKNIEIFTKKLIDLQKEEIKMTIIPGIINSIFFFFIYKGLRNYFSSIQNNLILGISWVIPFIILNLIFAFIWVKIENRK